MTNQLKIFTWLTHNEDWMPTLIFLKKIIANHSSAHKAPSISWQLLPLVNES